MRATGAIVAHDEGKTERLKAETLNSTRKLGAFAREANRMVFDEKNISKPRTASGSSRRGAEITSRAKEGFERRTPMDSAHFPDLAKGSCGEVRRMLYVAEHLEYLRSEEATILRSSAETLSPGIAAFTKHLRT